MPLCPNCGEDNPQRARFCLACGAALEAVAPKQERKLISVLFVDLVGFTARSDRADPEDVRDTLEAYHNAARREIEEFGGTLEKFIGDAVMAIFGAPVSHGDDAERAVRAGLRVLQAIDELNLSQPGLELAARAAVNSGEAVVSIQSGPASGEALAMGDVVNTASRLQAAAPAGGLVVGEETYLLTRHAVRYEELAPKEAKGKADPIRAWLALAPGVGRVERSISPAPMVGREREMALLEAVWDRAVSDRRPQLVTVLGPPGIGKSRLQREFSNLVRTRGGGIQRGRCLPYGARAAYGAFAQLVGEVAGVFENDAPDLVRTKVAGAVEKVLPAGEVEETTRYISLLIGLGVDQAADDRLLLFFAARRFIDGLASAGPLLMVFEDVHWADAGMLDLIEYLASHLREAPVTMLVLARPEFLDRRASWGTGLVTHTTVGLEPLSDSDAAVLAEHLLASAAGLLQAVGRLAEAAEGNPLFVEELTAALVEARDTDGKLPTTIKAAIAARLDALPPTARTVLLDAAVIGRTFWRGALMALGGHEDLDLALDALEARDFIRRVPSSRVEGDQEFIFKHMLIREVAYATLPRSLRRERHAAVASYIESAVGETRDLAALLAHHWREAGEPGRAMDYLMRAAEQAQEGWALEEVVALYDAALELADRDEQRWRIRLARGQAQVELEDFEAAVDDLGPLLPELSGKDRVEGLLAWTRATHWTERSEETIAGAQEALELAQKLGDQELAALATARLGQGHAMRGDAGDLDRAVDLGERALEIWVPGSRPADRTEHEYLLGDQYYWTGRLAEAGALMSSLTDSAGDPHSIEARLRGASLRATVLSATGRYEEALALFDQTIALGRELGRPVRVVQNYSTVALRDVFDLEEARRRTEEALEGVGWPGFSMPRANAMADLVQTALLAGDLGTAEQAWRTQWEDSSQSHAWSRWLVTGRLAAARADMALQWEGPEAAAEWALKAIELAQPVRRLKYDAIGRTTLGRALLKLRRGPEAVLELQTAVRDADRLGSPPPRWQARAALGDAFYATGDDAGAERALGEAAAILRAIAASLSPERAARFLAADPVREVLGGAIQTA